MYKEIERLELVLNQGIKINLDELSFTEELALIRIIEEIGGIAKAIVRFGVDLESLNNLWTYSIRTRDKISHSYETLTIEPLISAVKDFPALIKDIPKIKSLLKEI